MKNGFFKRMASLGSSYMLGTFNDNFFKQSALLLAVSLGYDSYQAWGTLLFALPFVLFSAWGGWLADRFPKKSIVIAAKCVELAAMLIGAWGIVRLNWGAIMVMLFCMGGSSTLFSPALNGSIPELFPRDTVPKVNGIFKLCTTVTILLGVMLAGYALERTWIATAIPFGRWLVGGGVILAAISGLVCAFFIPSWSAPVNRTARFPWLGAWDSLQDFWRLRSDRPLTLTLIADMFFYGLSTLALLEINALGMEELGFSMTLTSLLPVALMAGICAGSLLAAKGTPESWKSWLVPAIVGIGISLMAAGASAWLPLSKTMHFWCLMAAYGVAGLCGGIYIIPVSSFIQVRPAAGEKGRILGIGNCLSFAAIMMAGPTYGILSFLSAATGHLLVGAATLLIAAAFFLFIKTLPEENPDGTSRPAPFPKSLARLLRFLVSLRYRVTVEGLDTIRPDGRPLLFLPNHSALTDPILLYSRLAHLRPRPLADASQIDRPLVRTFAGLTRPVTIPDLRTQGVGRSKARAAVEEALKRCADALNSGDNLLFYPAGALTRDGSEHLGANSGVQRLLAAAPQTRVILVRTRGLWGSSFSYAEGQPDTIRGMLRGALRLLANLIFFMPKRRVHIHMEELPQAGQMAAQSLQDFNHALESWYGTETGEKALVPYFFWQGSTPKALAIVPKAQAAFSTEFAVSETLRREVLDIISQSVDNANAGELSPETRLGADLGIDSLAMTELAARLEEVQGHRVERLETLVTVEDCVLAAAGLVESGEKTPEAPKEWFARDAAPALRLEVPPADNLPQAILRQARKAPQSLILSDAQSAMSWREFWIKVRALALLLRRRLPEVERIGVMLPASSAATLSWLAVLMAGKTPVMLNWTAGAANFAHCVRLTGLSAVLTARALLDRLEDQGFEPEKAAPEDVRWLFLEDEIRTMPLALKLAAFVSSRLALRGGEKLIMPRRMSETAAILFTSGSETAPKGVPLTHANILANCRDIAKVAALTSHDRMLAMLPPFHSLGLTITMVLPLCFGMSVVTHPNPTEALRLNRLCRRWKPTIVVAPPTFLAAMLHQAKEGDLASLRLGVVGAETCPLSVYEAFAAQCGGVLCEGYGITECAPVVSVNRPDNPRPATIGQPLPSVQTAVVTVEGTMRRVPEGETGMLLVRGPNIFEGYLAGKDMPAPSDPFVDFEGERWYRTGDLVKQTQDGHLTFAGRLGRFVKLGGEMISLPQMEQALLAYQAARDAQQPQEENAGPALAVEAVEHDGQPELVLCSRVPFTVAEANSALRKANLSALYAVRRVLELETLPLLGSGKTDYRTLKKMIAETEEKTANS